MMAPPEPRRGSIQRLAALPGSVKQRYFRGDSACHEQELLQYATEELSRIKGLRVIGTAREKASVLSFVLDGFRSEDVGAAPEVRAGASRARRDGALLKRSAQSASAGTAPIITRTTTHAAGLCDLNFTEDRPVPRCCKAIIPTQASAAAFAFATSAMTSSATWRGTGS